MIKKSTFIVLSFFVLLLALTSWKSQQTQPVVAAPDESPTWVTYGNRLALNLSSTWAYYTVDRSGDDGTNCTDTPDIYRYGRVNSAQIGTMETGCDVPQASTIAADGDYLYYTYAAFQNPVFAYRQPIAGGEPEQIIAIGTVGNAIALDDTYAYFTMLDPTTGDMAIVKVDKATLLLEIVVQLPTVVGDRINKMTVDDNYIYWTEGRDINEGAVRAVAKTGGIVFTAAEAGTERPGAILVDGDYLYWAEAGGRIRRILKSGGPTETLHDGDDPVYSIFIRDETLYYSKGRDNGSISRMSKNGGISTLMAFDLNTPHSLALVGNRLYWAESSSIYYIDKNNSTTGVDYALYKLEVTQGIQDGVNSMPLVSNKATYVRAYPYEIIGTSQKLVNAHLYGYDADGRPLPGSPLSPIQKVDVQYDGAQRSDVDDSFVFLLPEAWTAADFQLQAEINPDDGNRVYETNYTFNFYPEDAPVSFSVNDRVACMIALPVIAEDGKGNIVIPNLFANGTQFYDNLERAETLLPATMRVYPYPTILLLNEAYNAYDLTQKSERSYLMSILASYNLISDISPFYFLSDKCEPEATAIAGLVHTDAATTDTSGDKPFSFGGQGNPSTQSMWSKLLLGTTHQPFNQPRGAVTIAHEVGHVFGRSHVDCNNPKNPDADYPYNPCLLGNSNGNNAFWGFDGLNMIAIDPMDTVPGIGAGDLMSYRKNRWPSDYTWRAIYDAIGVAQQGLFAQNIRAEATAATGDVIMVRGMIDATAVTGSLQPIYQYESTQLTPKQQIQLSQSIDWQGASTDYVIQLVDGGGTVLYTQPFIAEPEAESPDDPLLVHLTMPFDSDTAQVRLVVVATQQVLAVQDVSPHTPTVQFDGPPQVDTDGNLTVSWNGQDTDNDPLWYVLQYSPDGVGRVTLNLDGQSTSATLPTDYLPGSATGELWLYATDGSNTSAWATTPIHLEPHAPLAQITAPYDGQRLLVDTQVTLRGTGWDAEDGPLSADSLAWYVDDEWVGNGRWLAVGDLSIGEHTARLMTTDSHTETAIDAVTFTIIESEYLYLPIILR